MFRNLSCKNLIEKTVWFMIIITIQELGNTSSQDNAEWPWSQAFTRFTGSMGKYSDIKGLNLSTVVMHENQVYKRQEWQKQRVWSLRGIRGEEIRIGCRIVNGTAHKKAILISASTTPTHKHLQVCSRSRELDCWYNFTLVQTVQVVCLWAHDTIGLSFKFQINATTEPININK